MSDSHAKQIQMLNQYIAALERQIKSLQTERQSLVQELTKTEQMRSKSDQELNEVKKELRNLNAILIRQNSERTDLESHFKLLIEDNEKLKKEHEFKQQKITQLNSLLNQKNDLLAKQKNYHSLAKTYHVKQLSAVEEKCKEVESKLNRVMEEKICLSVKFKQTDDLLANEKLVNQNLYEKIVLKDKQIEVLELKSKTFEHDLKVAQEEKQGLKAKLEEVSGKFQLTSLELENSIKKSKELAQQIVFGNQNNQQAIKSYESLLQSARAKYEEQISSKSMQISSKVSIINHQIGMINEKDLEIVRLNQIICEKNTQISSFKTDLFQQNSNFAQQCQKNTQLSKEIIQLTNKINKLQEDYTLKCAQFQSKSQQIQLKTSELEIKVKQCDSLNVRISQLTTQIKYYKNNLLILEAQKNAETNKLKAKVESTDDELIDYRKKQAKLTKSLKESEEKLGKSLQELAIFKESSDKKFIQLKKRISQLEKQLQINKQKLTQKEKNLQNLSFETEFKIKELMNKDQQTAKRHAEIQSKYEKLKVKLGQTEKQLDFKDIEYNRKIDKFIIDHKNQLVHFKIKAEEQLKSLLSRSQQDVSVLNLKLSNRNRQFKELQDELEDLKLNTQRKLTFNLSSMEKKASIFQIQLEDTRKQLVLSHENLAILELAFEKMKDQLMEKDVKIQSLTIQVQKTKKDNDWLLNEGAILRAQIEALQNSTLYLKKQITSTLDQQQKSLKEIRSLKETKKQMSKLVISGVVSSSKKGRQRTESSLVLDGARLPLEQSNRMLDLELQSKKSDLIEDFNRGYLSEKKQSGSSYKTNSDHTFKFLTSQSVPDTIHNLGKGKQKNKDQAEKDCLDAAEFKPPSIISSSIYFQDEREQKINIEDKIDMEDDIDMGKNGNQRKQKYLNNNFRDN